MVVGLVATLKEHGADLAVLDGNAKTARQVALEKAQYAGTAVVEALTTS